MKVRNDLIYFLNNVSWSQLMILSFKLANKDSDGQLNQINIL